MTQKDKMMRPAPQLVEFHFPGRGDVPGVTLEARTREEAEARYGEIMGEFAKSKEASAETSE